jgi:D-amino peptidase
MKVVIMTDIEGVAGVVSFHLHSKGDATYYESCKRLLTAEINAAVAGLVEAGLDDILVVDGHGPGGIVFEELQPPARLLHGRPTAPRRRWAEAAGEYDAAMMIGQHAMEGVETANLHHTQSSDHIDYYKLNGRFVGEIAQFALFCGGVGVPMIFLSGDEAACREVEELIPGVTTAAVKRGLSRNSAISLAAPAARDRIRAGAREAVERFARSPFPPLRWDGPYVLEKRFFHTDAADAAMARPGTERVDAKTVRLRADDILDVIYA